MEQCVSGCAEGLKAKAPRCRAIFTDVVSCREKDGPHCGFGVSDACLTLECGLHTCDWCRGCQFSCTGHGCITAAGNKFGCD